MREGRDFGTFSNRQLYCRLKVTYKINILEFEAKWDSDIRVYVCVHIRIPTVNGRQVACQVAMAMPQLRHYQEEGRAEWRSPWYSTYTHKHTLALLCILFHRIPQQGKHSYNSHAPSFSLPFSLSNTVSRSFTLSHHRQYHPLSLGFYQSIPITISLS